MHRLRVVGANENRPDASATTETETATQVEEEENEDSSSSVEPVADVEELKRATPAKIWCLRVRSLERWFPLLRPTEEGSLF